MRFTFPVYSLKLCTRTFYQSVCYTLLLEFLRRVAVIIPLFHYYSLKNFDKIRYFLRLVEFTSALEFTFSIKDYLFLFCGAQFFIAPY